MRRRHTKRFSKRRQRVSWLTQPNQLAGELLSVGQNHFLLGINADNDFVQSHPRFAKRNDVIALKRIVGRLRLAMYFNESATYPVGAADAVLAYGIALIKGDYDDSGTWTPPADIPDPTQASDQDEKWLFLDRCILSPGQTLTIPQNGGTGVPQYLEGGALLTTTTVVDPQPLIYTTQNARPAVMSNDMQLPNGSFIDISTRRKAQYAEKLAIIVNLAYGGDVDMVDFYVEPFLRVLIGG